MAQLPVSPRVGRSQGVSIFWGLVSVFFAAAACFYFWNNHENEAKANILRDQVLGLQEERDSLNAEKDKMQEGLTDRDKQLKTREEFLQEKESKLAAEETRLEALGAASLVQAQQTQSQASVVKKFDDTVRKLAKGEDTDVVLRGGRPVLRVPDSIFFAYGEATLKPTGKALLAQIAQALDGQLDNFELRVECYTDSEGESQKAEADTPPPAKSGSTTNAPAKTPPPEASSPHFANGWDLTAARAAVINRYFHDSSSLPFGNVIVIGRNDSQPIVTEAKEGHARNRRIEITITPEPVPYHPPDAPKSDSTSSKSDSKPSDDSKPKDESKSKSDSKPDAGSAKPKTPAKPDAAKAKATDKPPAKTSN